MSTLISQARTRVPRFAEAAVERARLTVVPPRRAIGRTQAARTPFAVLVIAMLVAGVVGLLTFNTNMQQASFEATALQDKVTTLTAQQQGLSMELDALRNPQRLAVAAKKLGMVAPAQPAFIDLATGTVLGTAQPATTDGSVRINPLPTPTPNSLKRKVIRVPAKKTAANTTSTTSSAGTTKNQPGDTRSSSTGTTQGTGRKKGNASSDSGATH